MEILKAKDGSTVRHEFGKDGLVRLRFDTPDGKSAQMECDPRMLEGSIEKWCYGLGDQMPFTKEQILGAVRA